VDSSCAGTGRIPPSTPLDGTLDRFPDLHSSFLIPHSSFACISLWYVIEHFRDCVPVLKEIRTLLKPGGVWAFATPSFSRASGRFSLKRFLECSPADHWTIWSPTACKKVLKNAGFLVIKMVNSGHHPERFTLLGKYAKSKKSPLYWLSLAVSKIFSLGDTFEVYATATTEEQPK
jgi:ubiquinone/menaquinone biosynthesis C-methylase UbiE